jgi:hypothetical protein
MEKIRYIIIGGAVFFLLFTFGNGYFQKRNHARMIARQESKNIGAAVSEVRETLTEWHLAAPEKLKRESTLEETPTPFVINTDNFDRIFDGIDIEKEIQESELLTIPVETWNAHEHTQFYYNDIENNKIIAYRVVDSLVYILDNNNPKYFSDIKIQEGKYFINNIEYIVDVNMMLTIKN